MNISPISQIGDAALAAADHIAESASRAGAVAVLHADPPADAVSRAGASAVPVQDFARDAVAAHKLVDSVLVPHGSGGLADALRAGRLLNTGDPAALDHVERILRSGTPVAHSEVPIGGAMNINGALTTALLVDPDDSANVIRAVRKSPGAQAPQEEFAWQMARAMGIDHLVAPVARRADGDAWIAWMPGSGLAQAGVWNLDDVESMLARGYRKGAPELAPADGAQAARIDRDLLGTFDWLLANPDRSGANAIAERETSRLHYIDHGHIGRGDVSTDVDPLVPNLRGTYQALGSGRSVVISPEARAIIEQRLTQQRVSELHPLLSTGPEPAISSLNRRFLPHVQSQRYLDNILARLNHVVRHSSYSYQSRLGGGADPAMPPLLGVADSVRGLHNVKAHMFDRPPIGRF